MTSDTTPSTPITEENIIADKTRHGIINAVLGHPTHVIAHVEFREMLSEPADKIQTQLHVLTENNILTQYQISDAEQQHKSHPKTFWGPTETGIHMFDATELLMKVPVHRALYDQTEKTTRMHDLTGITRPTLPEDITDALSFNENVTMDYSDNTNTSLTHPVFSESTIPPISPSDERESPYYISSTCMECGTELVLYDSLPEKTIKTKFQSSTESDAMWYDEWVCPSCLDGIYLDLPNETSNE
jgi:hypothetical protein